MNYALTLLALREYLKHRKTYLTAFAAALTALGAWAAGAISDVELVRSLFEVTGLVTVRAGVAKIGAPATTQPPANN